MPFVTSSEGSPLQLSRSPVAHYGIAVLAVALTLIIKLLLDPLIGRETPFLLFFGAVMASAWYGGRGPGLFATLLAALVTDYFFLPPYNALSTDLPDVVRITTFALEGVLISFLSGAMQSALRRARESADEARGYQELSNQREAVHRLMIEEVRDFAIIMMDTDGRVTHWNKGAENIFGYEETEAKGREASFIFTPEDRESGAPEHELSTACEKGRAEDERWHLRKDNTRFWASGVVSATRDEAGNLRGFAKVARDVTHRRQMEEALLVAEWRAINEYEHLLDRLVSLADTLGTARDLVAIFRALRDFAIASVPCIGVFVSLYDAERKQRTAAYAWGDGEEVEVSKLPTMPITADGPNSCAITTGKIVITDNYMEKMKGHSVVSVGPTPDRLPQSSLVAPMIVMNRIVGTIEVQAYEQDAYKDEHVTAMRMAGSLAAIAIENARLFARESRARAIAEEGNRAKDEFLATLSHELRTPLTSILGWSHLLRSGQLNAETTTRALETIERNARAQTKLIDDLLDVSRIITGKLRLNMRPTELMSVISAAIDAARPAANARNIELNVAQPEAACTVNGDPDRLQQIVWNLISNAIKFTHEGGNVSVQIECAESTVSLRVIDTGKGISAEFLPHVFDRFRQADSTTTRQHGGLGLGLAIVRQLIEMHGGTIRAESAGEGEGATFIAEFPLMKAADDDSQTTSMARFSQTKVIEGFSADCPPSLKGSRVLVIDDEADAREVLTMILKQCGAEVFAADSVNNALEKFRQWQPDVVVSDIGMPHEDGYALIAKMRALPVEQGGTIPAIALTAYARPEDRERALAAGYQQHVSKPIEAAELASAVASLIERNGKKQESKR